MKIYRIDDQTVISDKNLSVGEELIANITDGAHEKHVPVIEQNGSTVTVKVGSVEHPSLPAHYIEWILLATEQGFQIRYLKPGMRPEAKFVVNEPVIAAYEYCNLHGLWKAEV
jgi:superoxide reductase